MYFDEEGFERKNNDSADYSDVLAALEALHAAKTEPKRWRRALEAVFDVDDFLHWLAMNTAMSNWDAYGRMAHNYYLYGDPAEDGRLNWIPWDHNMAFGIRGGGLPDMRDMRGGRSVGLPLEVMAMPGDDILHTEAGDSWPLISRLLEDDVYAARYRKLLAQTFDGLLAPAAFEARAAELHALIAPYVVGEFGERRTHTTLRSQANFENSVVALVRFAASRQDQVRDALASD
jgi:hypothetical protein